MLFAVWVKNKEDGIVTLQVSMAQWVNPIGGVPAVVEGVVTTPANPARAASSRSNTAGVKKGVTMSEMIKD